MLRPILALLVLVFGCSSPEGVRRDFEQADGAGEHAEAEAVLRAGLEKHPDDPALLVVAGSFYLRSLPPESYKPRLALHYAMRAAQETQANDPDALALLKRAQLAAGGLGTTDLASKVLRRGLDAVGEYDAQPKGFRPFDADLLDGTGAQVKEQLARWKARDEAGPVCPGGMASVAAGTWDLKESTDVAGFCVDERAEGGLVVATDPTVRDLHCANRDLRACSDEELAVACGPLKAVLPDHPGCADPRIVRCCAGLAGGQTMP
jgi:hypothetical protein